MGVVAGSNIFFNPSLLHKCLTMLLIKNARSEELLIEDNTTVDLGNGVGSQSTLVDLGNGSGEVAGGQRAGEEVGDQVACDQGEEDSLFTPPVACSTLSEIIEPQSSHL